jgi:hypothetical protein
MLRRPIRTQNLPPLMTVPSCGQTKYTWAFSGAGVGAATAVPVCRLAASSTGKTKGKRMIDSSCLGPTEVRVNTSKSGTL